MIGSDAYVETLPRKMSLGEVSFGILTYFARMPVVIGEMYSLHLTEWSVAKIQLALSSFMKNLRSEAMSLPDGIISGSQVLSDRLTNKFKQDTAGIEEP